MERFDSMVLLSSRNYEPFFGKWVLGEVVKAAGQAGSDWDMKSGSWPMLVCYLELKYS